MAESAHIGLDNPAFNGRLRRPLFYQRSFAAGHVRRPARTRTRYFDQQVRQRQPGASPSSPEKLVPIWMQPLPESPRAEPTSPNFETPQPQEPQQMQSQAMPPVSSIALVEPQPFATPAELRPQRSRVLNRQSVRSPFRKHRSLLRQTRYTKVQLALVGMACLIFVAGLAVTFQTEQTDHNAAVQVAALAKKANNSQGNSQNSPVPSTTKPSANAFNEYTVAPNLPRYIKIPKLGVYARVLQVGVTKSGALGTPDNVFDTAWYTGSAKPGQPGATLIDGHVSSWTAHGVFYGLHTLIPGDKIQIVRGDGTVLNYKVVKKQIYNTNNVDMKAAMTPVTPGKSGLNLITCTGQVIHGTSEFNERVIVFAQQV